MAKETGGSSFSDRDRRDRGDRGGGGSFGAQGSMSDWDPSCKVYIGGLRDDANKYDIEDAFNRYGVVKNVWVARKPPGFAFVEMEDSRDAEDSVRGLDGTRICGARVKVEMSTGGRSRGGGSSERGRDRDRRRSRSRSRGRDRSRSVDRSRSRSRSR